MTHLAVQELLHLGRCGGVVSDRVPVEQRAGPPVCVDQEQVDILAGADQPVVIVVSVENNKTGGSN